MANAIANTTTLLTSSSGNNPSTYGSSVTFTATVQTNGVTAGNATSNYVFKVDGTPVATNVVTSGQAAYVTSLLTVGTHTITAEYAGSSSYTASTNSLTQNVSQAPLGITANSTNKVYDGVAFSGGNGVTYSGFVNGQTNTALGGSLSFGGTAQGATNAGSYTILPAGLTSANYAITFNSGTLTVNPASIAPGLTSTNNPSGYRDNVAFIATLPADATGNVVFASTNGSFSTNAVSGGSVTSLSVTNLPRGTNLITSVYSGDGNYLASTNTLNQIVTNHPPVLADATYYRAKEMSLKIAITSLLTNATDVDADSFTLQSVGAGTNSATILTNEIYVFYLPGTATNSNSNDTVTYTVSDGFGGSATANIFINTYTAAGPAQMSIPANNTVNITFFGIPNYTYVVQTTTNLNTPWWIISTNTAGTDGSWQFTDLNATNDQQYYRSAQP